MPLILLIRHGENEYVKKGRLAGRIPGVHLNEKGKDQAQQVADHLKGTPIKAVYSSPLERAVETAEPLASALGLVVQQRPGLIEVNFGEWQDKRLKQLARTKIWRSVQYAPARFSFPGGETFAEAQNRIRVEIESIAALSEPKDIVALVTHSDPIKLAVAFYLGMPLDMFQRLTVAPASITALMLSELGAHLLALNYEISFTLPKT